MLTCCHPCLRRWQRQRIVKDGGSDPDGLLHAVVDVVHTSRLGRAGAPSCGVWTQKISSCVASKRVILRDVTRPTVLISSGAVKEGTARCRCARPVCLICPCTDSRCYSRTLLVVAVSNVRHKCLRHHIFHMPTRALANTDTRRTEARGPYRAVVEAVRCRAMHQTCHCLLLEHKNGR